MRIRKLGLRRYGKFTDAFIDFGERVPGFADMHIVYGPNEAGKSTAMSACTDLIFGILAQSRFNFLHPYATMRIEAEVEISGGIRRFCRLCSPEWNRLAAYGLRLAVESNSPMFFASDRKPQAASDRVLAQSVVLRGRPIFVPRTNSGK